jgi:hypothetical protein
MGTSHLGQEIWFRYFTYYRDDEFRVKMKTIPVISHTRTGVWIFEHKPDGFSPWIHFIKKDARFPYCCETAQQAREVFVASLTTHVAAKALGLLEKGQIDQVIWSYYPHDFQRMLRELKGIIPECLTCRDTGLVLHWYPRGPNDPPRNQFEGCEDCEPGRAIRAEEKAWWEKLYHLK